MSRIIYTTSENGWVSSNSKEYSTMAGRITTCKGCGYEQKAWLPSRLDTKMWRENHTLEFCRSRKAFNELLGNPLEELAKLSIR